MAIRSVPFVEGEYYHIFNRGVDKRNIFEDQTDIFYFFHRLIDLNTEINFGHDKTRNLQKNKSLLKDTKPLVNIIAYCLLPNHFHIILKEESSNGISRFMQKLGTSYTKYFNKKYNRSGSLFQGKFKSVHITGHLGLVTLSTYVNLNYKHHGLSIKNPLVKSSLPEFLEREKYDTICTFQEIIEMSGSLQQYKHFLVNTEKIFIEHKQKDGKLTGNFPLDFDELEN